MLSDIVIESAFARSPEATAVRTAAVMAKSPVRVRTAECCVAAPDTLPVGSVAFVETALKGAGRVLPEPIDYPSPLVEHCGRAVLRAPLGEVRGRAVWVKPWGHYKQFVPGLCDRAELDPLPDDLPVWWSRPVRWLSEHRYYVLDGRILFFERYDPDGEDGAPSPDPESVQAMVGAYQRSGEAPAGYALDVGVLDTGVSALVEVNDGYAIGYYGPVTPARASDNLALLWRRYREMAWAA
jgi:hypothetical protein